MIELGSAHAVDEAKPGVIARFVYDAGLLERFRVRFPSARWRPDSNGWFVPGKTAPRRVESWLAEEARSLSDHDDDKGHDAYAFDPIKSPYLTIGDDLVLRTPFSRTILAELRAIPWARWDEAERLWHVPFRSYDALRQRWPAIEAAALRHEPEEKRRRLAAAKDSEAYRSAQRRAREKQRFRYPVVLNALPLLGRPLMTDPWGIVVFDALTGELVDAPAVSEFYPHLADNPEDHVWATWHSPDAAELDPRWASRQSPGEAERRHGWWRPGFADFREAGRRLRTLARARKTRRRKKVKDNQDEAAS